MRKVNLVISIIILILFAVHAVLGCLTLTYIRVIISKGLTHTILTLVAVHIIIGFILACKTNAAQRRSGIKYKNENRLFWLRRDSGFLIAVLIGFHMASFISASRDEYVLPRFTPFMLVMQLLFLTLLGVHVTTNIEPLLIGAGIMPGKKIRVIGTVFFSLLLLAAVASFVVYFIGWQKA